MFPLSQKKAGKIFPLPPPLRGAPQGIFGGAVA